MDDGIPEPLAALAEAHGVATAYTGSDGQRVDVPATTVRAVLAAMGVAADDEASAEASLRAHEHALAARLLPDVHVVWDDRDETRRVVAGAPVDGARLLLEDGGRRDVPVDGGVVALPADLPLGAHGLWVHTADREAEATVLVAPGRCPLPEQRQWGWMAQLYQLRSAASWGLGDAGDLRELATASGRDLGAGFVVCNPLHAVVPVTPVQASPYFPTSRRFVTPLTVRVADVPEAAGLPPEDRRRLEALEETGRALNDTDLIDHDAVCEAKLAALELVHRVPRTREREEAYAAYRRRQGDALVDFATFCALAEEHGLPWQDWPADLRDPRSATVAAARRRLADRVELHTWLQWVAHEQLTAAQAAAREAGMPIGVVHDLAVGVDPGGAEAWALQDELAGGVRVGAPPDDLNRVGQDWGLPPLRPDRLLATGLATLRSLLRSVLAHAGGVRIDHALGLFRLYWIPEGASAAEGTYVDYPTEAMLAALTLEAHRAGAVVVGEDLGTVGEGVRERLRDAGVLGSQVLYFEWQGDRRTPADAYAERALASVTTHDLPTAVGWWRDRLVDLWVERDLLGEGTTEQDARAGTAAERAAMRELLVEAGLVDHDADEPELVVAMHAFLAATPSLLVAASPADAVGDPRQPNLPGTVDSYPNWRLPLAEETEAAEAQEPHGAEAAGDGLRPVSLERFLAHPGTRRLARVLQRP